MEGPVHGVSYSYEPNRDLMSSIDNKAGNLTGSSISKYSYQHDALNRRTDRTQSGSAIATTSTDTFSYNPRSEVIGSGNDIATAAVWNPSYTYDPIGNRLTSTGFFDSSYVTNELNQYTELSVSSPPREPVHDKDGNLIESGTGWTYVWNGENRLVQATNGTITIDFTYDYRGRLVKKDDGTDVKVYVYDDWNRIAEFHVSPSTGSGHTFTLTSVNVWGMDLSGSMQGAGGVGSLLKEGDLYPLYDANGNIMQKLDDTGSIAMNVAYDPFGNIIDGTLVGEYGFSTKPLIEHLNWYYYGFRYYDPETGRWPSRDPIEEWGGINLYAFVYNDPVNWWDYLGLDPCCSGGKRLDCTMLRNQNDLLFRQFTNASNALRDNLEFQFDSELTLFGVDRAIDAASGLVGIGVKNAVNLSRTARAKQRVSQSKLIQGGTFKYAGSSTSGNIIRSATQAAPGFVAGSSARQGLRKPSKWSTHNLRNDIQSNIDNLNDFIQNLSNQLSDLRATIRRCC